METFSALVALFAECLLVTGEFPSQRPATWSFDFSLILWSAPEYTVEQLPKFSLTHLVFKDSEL